jgi:hypothetical protein
VKVISSKIKYIVGGLIFTSVVETELPLNSTSGPKLTKLGEVCDKINFYIFALVKYGGMQTKLRTG